MDCEAKCARPFPTWFDAIYSPPVSGLFKDMLQEQLAVQFGLDRYVKQMFFAGFRSEFGMFQGYRYQLRIRALPSIAQCLQELSSENLPQDICRNCLLLNFGVPCSEI